MTLSRSLLHLKKGIPFLICLFLILLAQTPAFFITSVPFLFIPIFYFAIFRPGLLNDYAVFVLGLFADLIGRTPVGLWAFIFVLLFFAARLNRLFLGGLRFDKLWLVFAVFSAVALMLRLLLFFLCAGAVVPGGFLVGQYIILNLLYPLGIMFCGRLDRWIEVDS